MKKSTSRFSALLRAGALVAVLGVGALAANAQTFLYDGVVYKASGNKLTAQAATTKPENGDAPGNYSGDIVIPSSLTYNNKEYVVTSIGGVFKAQPITSIKIGDGVATISRGCFQDCVELTSVELPSDMTTMNGDLFNGCLKLEEITIPGGVKEISSNQFKNCPALKKIVFDEGETPIEIKAAMWGGEGLSTMTSLSEIVLNRGIGTKYTDMADKPFRGSTVLTDVTLGGTLTEIPTSYFENCTALKNVTIGENVTSMGTNVFTASGVEEITLPESITSVANSTFKDCASLKKVTLGNAVTSIQNTAFQGCGVLSEINFPETLQSIGVLAFSNANLQGEIVLPEALTSIGEQAFAQNKKITSVSFGENLRSLGEGAFAGCSEIAKYTVAEGNEAFSTAENGALLLADGGKTVMSVAPASDLTELKGEYTKLSSNAANGAKKITVVDLPECATWGDYSLYGTGIESLTISGIVGRYVAANCPELKELTISGKEVPFGIAAEDAKLEKVTFTDPITTVKQEAFQNTTSLKSLDLGTILSIIEADAFKGSALENLTVSAANPAAMTEGVFTEESKDITATVPNELVDTYKNATGWSYLNIVGDANLASGPADMGMPAGLYYAGTDGNLHAVYADGGTDTYDVGGVPHTFQLAQFKNRIYGASAGVKFYYEDPSATQGDGKLFYISQVGGENFQAVVLDNTGGNAYEDPFGLYVYGDLLYVNDRNVCIRKIPADAIALPKTFEHWVENNWLGFYGSPWSYGCIKAGWAITKGTDKDGNPEPVYWVGMKYNGNGIYRFREEHVGTSSAAPGTKPENGVFLNSLNPIFTTFHIDEENGHMYIYIEKAGNNANLVKGGLYRVNVADLEANPDPSDFSTLNPVLIDGAPVLYEGSSTNEHVGISQLTPDENNEYLYWCYRAATQANVDAVAAGTAGRYDWAEELDPENPLHKSGIKRIKLGEAKPEVEMVAPGVEGYGVVPVNYESSKTPGGVNEVVIVKENALTYANGALTVAEDAVVNVYNMNGMLVASNALRAGESMSVENLEAGAYVAAAGNSVVKFVK